MRKREKRKDLEDGGGTGDEVEGRLDSTVARSQRRERFEQAFSRGQRWIQLKPPLICMALILFILCNLMADAVMVGGGSGSGAS